MQLNKIYLAGLVLAMLAGAAIEYKFNPPQTKTVTVEHETVRTDVHTVTKVVERPDGSKETIVDTTDHSKTDEARKADVVVIVPKNWLVGAGAILGRSGLQPDYAIYANRRILGPLYLGAQADTSGRIGAYIGMEF